MCSTCRIIAEVGDVLDGSERARTLVVEVRGCTLALPVDIVHEVQTLTESSIRPSHATRMRHSSAEVDVLGQPVPRPGSRVGGRIPAGGGGWCECLTLKTAARALRSSRLTYRSIPPALVAPLPGFAPTGGGVFLISGIVFSPSDRPLIVLDT